MTTSAMSKFSAQREKTATLAIQTQRAINEQMKDLDALKETLRGFANGEKDEIVIEGEGKVLVSAPREGSEIETVEFMKDEAAKYPDLFKTLVKKGILVVGKKNVGAAKASVTIKPNV